MRPSVFSALVSRDAAACALYPRDFADAASWDTAAASAAARRTHPDVVRELTRQSQALPPSATSAARDRHIAALGEPGTTVVVTGQQVGLFGGPLYTLHKAATAVARARWLAERTGRPCVPVFWLQTEDHDYAEIRAVTALAPSGPVTFALPEEPAPSRVSVAHRRVPASIHDVLGEVEAALGELPHGPAVVALLRTHYQPGRLLAAAFGGLVAELFREEGLVTFDPRSPAVAAVTTPLLARVLAEHDALCTALDARCEAIAAAGFGVQVPPRKGTSLVFFHPSGEEGARHRLVRRGTGFETPEGAIDAAALAGLLETDPLRFSTSALLRPLVQDTLLPTAAYLGGPAEVSYFAELAPIYAALDVTMPVVAPRARLRLVEPTVRSLLGRLEISAANVETKAGALLGRLAARDRGERPDTTLAARLVAPLDRELDALAALALHDLIGPIQRARDACTRALEALAAKAERALAERDRVLVERVERVTSALYPSETPQERAYGFLGIAARVGITPLVRAIVDAAGAFDPNPRDVEL